jgi:hypothetical protein
MKGPFEEVPSRTDLDFNGAHFNLDIQREGEWAVELFEKPLSEHDGNGRWACGAELLKHC